jgi:hypothetical protein
LTLPVRVLPTSALCERIHARASRFVVYPIAVRRSSLYLAAPSVCAVLGQGCQGAARNVAPAPQQPLPLAVSIFPGAESESVPARTEEPVAAEQGLARWGDNTPAKTRVFYTWTTKEQATEIRKGGPILQRSFSPGKGFATFDHVLSDLALAGDPLAQLLWHEGFAKSRFAWSNAFGVASFDERFGDVLLRISVDYGSHVLSLAPHGFEGAPVAKDAETIGAVSFNAGAYREYVLSNEGAIVRVEIATRDLLSDVRAQLAFLQHENSEDPVTLSSLFVHKHVLIANKHRAAAVALLTAYLNGPHEAYERSTRTAFALGAPRPPIGQLCKRLGLPIKTPLIDHMGNKTFVFQTKCPPDPHCFSFGTRCLVVPDPFQ